MILMYICLWIKLLETIKFKMATTANQLYQTQKMAIAQSIVQILIETLGCER